MGKITFGTSGWRAIIADDFTFANVRIGVAAIARYLKETDQASHGIVVAGDYRFFSEKFMQITCQVLADHGINSYLCPVGTPTPTVSYELLCRKAAGAINFTASHNPYDYQGLKFNGADGGPAPVEVTQRLEALAAELSNSRETIGELAIGPARERGLVKDVDPKPAYFERLRELVDFETIRKSRLRVVVDTMHGNGRGYLAPLLEEGGIKTRVLNDTRDPFFDFHHPEPSAARLADAAKEVKAWPANMALANDGDADRFGVLDTDGTYITPNQVMAILFDHLLKNRDWKGVVVRTLPTTHLIDAIAQANGVVVRETKVGFKYIAEVMSREAILIGGEESGGLSVHNHIPEKDGILACLLMAEVAARTGRTFSSILQGLTKEYGVFIDDRIDVPLKSGLRETLTARLNSDPPRELAGHAVVNVQTGDGFKFILDNGEWIMVRFSGTEPLMRCYVEAHTPQTLEHLKDAGRKLTEI